MALGIALFADGVGAAETTRVSTTLQAMEFNEVATRFMAMPTFVSIDQPDKRTTDLLVHMNTYEFPKGLEHSGLPDSYKYCELRFLKDHVAEYVAAIDKYLQWVGIAIQRKDAFTKEIGRVPTWSRASAKLIFEFHSGSDKEHFLVITMHSIGVDLGSQVYDPANAQELKRLLIAFAAGTIQQTDIDSVYK
jgi:hypothetical protein